MIDNKKIIAVCVARLQDETNSDYIFALNRAAALAGYHVLVYHTGSVIENENCYMDAQFYIYELMDYTLIDAVVICEEAMKNKMAVETIVQNAQKAGVPVIIYGSRREGCMNVGFEQETAFEEMVRHMLEEHHLTRLHFMAGIKGNSFSEQRLSIFKKIMEEHGLPVDDSMISYGDFWSVPAEQAAEEIVASGNLPEAIICANDKMAIAVCGVLNKYGIKIPEQVAVTGFDGIPEIEFSIPRITSVCCKASDIAEKTVDLLLHAEKYRGKTVSFLVPARLMRAESCGCMKKEPVDASRYLNGLNDRLYQFQLQSVQLAQIAAQVQRSETLEQVIDNLHDPMLYDMSIVVEKEYLQDEVNPSEQPLERPAPENREMMLLVDSNLIDGFRPYSMPLKHISPTLQYCMEENRAMVLTPLRYLGVPMGYVCFYFQELNHTQSSRITQITDYLNNALGAYRNGRYKTFLMQQIEELYRIDALTGLYNRRGFELAYQKMLENRKENLPLTIILADLDRLKYINDTFGHKEGDFAIRAVADALQKVCPEGSLFTRFGGDEMLAVCPDRIEPWKVCSIFEDYFRAFNDNSGKLYEVSASIGVYITEDNVVLDFEELIEKSDCLMYEEKERHRKKWEKE